MLKLLIIDDTRSVHAFIRRLLEKTQGVHTTFLHDGSEAIDLLDAGAQFDVILLDWEMPVLNGPATFEAIKKREIKTPVIFMTTKNQPSDIAQMFAAGVSEYMMKPFTLDILLEKIEFVTGKGILHAA